MQVLQHWHEQEIKRAFIDSWKIKGELNILFLWEHFIKAY